MKEKELEEIYEDVGPELRQNIDLVIDKLNALKKGIEQLEDETTGYTPEVNINNLEYDISEVMGEIHRGLINLQAYYKTKREKSL